MFKSIIIWLLKTVFSAFVDEIVKHRKEEANEETSKVTEKSE